MVTGVCLSYQYWVVDVWISGHIGYSNSITDNEFSGDKSRNCKPGEIFENRIKNNYDQKLFKANLAKFSEKQNLLVSEHNRFIFWVNLFWSYCSLGK